MANLAPGELDVVPWYAPYLDTVEPPPKSSTLQLQTCYILIWTSTNLTGIGNRPCLNDGRVSQSSGGLDLHSATSTKRCLIATMTFRSSSQCLAWDTCRQIVVATCINSQSSTSRHHPFVALPPLLPPPTPHLPDNNTIGDFLMCRAWHLPRP